MSKFKNFDQRDIVDFILMDRLTLPRKYAMWNELIDQLPLDELFEPMFSRRGPKAYPPKMMFKAMLVQAEEGLSDRELERRVRGDLYVRQFLGLSSLHEGIDHSTFANWRRRLGPLYPHIHGYLICIAKEKGLLRSGDDDWIVDSFHSSAVASKMSEYALIQSAARKLYSFIKKRNPEVYARLEQAISPDVFKERMPEHGRAEEKAKQFHRMAMLAYGLLVHTEKWVKLQTGWKHSDDPAKCEELMNLLRRVLEENVEEVRDDENTPPEDAGQAPAGDGETVQGTAGAADSLSPEVQREERIQYRPRKKKPRDRIINVHDPELRWGGKYGKVYLGDKFQVVVSRSTRLPLAIEPIPGNEHDSKSVAAILKKTAQRLGLLPRYVIADGAYGFGETRKALDEAGFVLVAPLPKSINPKGKDLLPGDEFTYLPDENRMRCPAGKVSEQVRRSERYHGTQYLFSKIDCQTCALREKCTPSDRRSVFVSDFADVIKRAKTFYKTLKDEVKAAMRSRMREEQTNYELKYPLGLAMTRYRGRDKRRMEGYAALVVLTIRRLAKLLAQPPQPAEAELVKG